MGQDCTVTTFVSDRAGVGQSMALSSTALVLAANGRRVFQQWVENGYSLKPPE